MQQSAQFEPAAQAERKYLADAVKVEVEASRQELVLAQARFQETSAQQSVHINSLKTKRALSRRNARQCSP